MFQGTKINFPSSPLFMKDLYCLRNTYPPRKVALGLPLHAGLCAEEVRRRQRAGRRAPRLPGHSMRRAPCRRERLPAQARARSAGRSSGRPRSRALCSTNASASSSPPTARTRGGSFPEILVGLQEVKFTKAQSSPFPPPTLGPGRF